MKIKINTKLNYKSNIIWVLIEWYELFILYFIISLDIFIFFDKWYLLSELNIFSIFKLFILIIFIALKLMTKFTYITYLTSVDLLY